MNALVTGASGFLGQALVRALLDRNHRVRALVRRPEASAELAALGAEPVLVDLDRPGWDTAPAPGATDLADRARRRPGAAIPPTDVIYHCAARVDLSGRWRDFQRTNIDGTRRLLEAVLPARPRRFVYVSSGAVYGPAEDPRGLCAARTPTRPQPYNHYGRSKLAAERLVQERCAAAGVEWTILRLGFLYGFGNRALLDHIGPLMARRCLILLGHGDNRLATLEISDAVAATLLAGAHPAAAGRIYDVASDEVVTQRQFFAATADALGLPRPWRNMRKSLAMKAACLIELAAAATGRRPALTRAMVDLMCVDQVMDASAIRDELDWRPRVDFAEGMVRMRAWYADRASAERGAAPADRAAGAPPSRVSRRPLTLAGRAAAATAARGGSTARRSGIHRPASRPGPRQVCSRRGSSGDTAA